jgi:hypothetical protein
LQELGAIARARGVVAGRRRVLENLITGDRDDEA